MDWLLNYAFYARNDTLTPALVGVASVGIYLFVALMLLEPFGYLGLVLADSAKHTGHFAIMLVLLSRRLGGLRDLYLGSTALKTAFAAAVMALVLAIVLPLLQTFLPAGFEGNLVLVLVAGVVGVLVYGGLVLRMGLPEARMLVNRIARRWRRN